MLVDPIRPTMWRTSIWITWASPWSRFLLQRHGSAMIRRARSWLSKVCSVKGSPLHVRGVSWRCLSCRPGLTRRRLDSSMLRFLDSSILGFFDYAILRFRPFPPGPLSTLPSFFEGTTCCVAFRGKPKGKPSCLFFLLSWGGRGGSLKTYTFECTSPRPKPFEGL